MKSFLSTFNPVLMKIFQTFFFLILFSAFHPLYAQKECKYEKNEIDGVTELRIKITSTVQVGKLNNAPLLFKAQSIGDRKYLKMRYYCYDNYILEPNSSIVFTLIDNSELTLNQRITNRDTAQYESGLTPVSYLLVFPLTPEQFDKLLHVPVKQLKVFIPGGYDIKEIKENHQAYLQEILSCLAND